jgi:glycine C-acetyltransferase
MYKSVEPVLEKEISEIKDAGLYKEERIIVTPQGAAINAELPTSTIGELSHPQNIKRNNEADLYAFNHHFGGQNLRFSMSKLLMPQRIARFVYRKLKAALAG